MKKRAKKIISMILTALVVTTTVPIQPVMAAEPEISRQEETVEPEVQSKESQQEETVESEVQAEESQQEINVEPEAQAEKTVGDPEIQAEKTVEDPEIQAENSIVDEAKDAAIGYVVVAEPYIGLNETQNILVGLGEDNTDIQNPVLNVVREEDGAVFQIPLSKQDGSAFLFTKQYAQDAESGTYRLESITYASNGAEVTKGFAEAGFDIRYGVNKEVETNPDAVVSEEDGAVDLDIVTIDENGNTTSQNTIGEALEEAGSSDGLNGRAKAASGNVVVVLDPGHDNTHAGASGNGLREETLNLKIAQYCKEELEQYAGVTVYMTRDDSGNCPYPGTTSTICNANRVAFAKSVGANVYVSIHINSTSGSSTTANGAQVYYPNGNYNAAVGSQGKQLASIIEEKLVALGLNERGITIRNSEDGTTYPDGSLADYYGVIKRSKEVGIPAVIVEHAFINNSNDVNNFLNSDEKLKKLGVADATAIAEYFGLSKSNLDLRGICYIYGNSGIDVGVDYATNGSNIRFKWLAYNLDTQQWSSISDWYGGNWATWQPEPGNYWLQVQAITDEGYSASYTIAFHVDKNYSPYAVNISGICYQYQENGIDIGVGYDSNDKNLQFKWLSYNLDTQQWETISDWYGGNWATWKAKPGNYWLQVQVKNSINQIESYTICFYNDKNYVTEPLTLDGIAYVVNEECIDIGAAYTATQSGTEFRWMSYNLDTQQWKTISDWNGGNWTNWYPEPGNYWLHVEARTKDGIVKDYTVCFAVQKDYSKKGIDITGICVLQENIGINIGVAYETKASNVKFKYSIYDLNNQVWSELAGWTGANWVTWYPESGSYWIYVEAVTEDGVTADKCIGYVVDSRYGIMGTSNTTVEQMVKYYNANQAYPVFYQNSDAPTIEDFCRIYLEECEAEGVRAEVAFCQAMKETGFLRFGGDVDISQFNFAGLGATGNGVSGNSFSSVREGIRAQVQHLKAYASTEPLKNACVDPRFGYVRRGTAPYVEWLGIQENPYTTWKVEDGVTKVDVGCGWATAKNYGYSIKKDYMTKLFSY